MSLPQQIGRDFHIEEEIEKSSSGTIYSVRSIIKPDNKFYLKFISVKGKNAQIRHKVENFIRAEFSLLQSLNHENIINVFEYGYDKELDGFYFVMEHQESVTLARFFKNNLFNTTHTKIFYEILKALSYLHTKNIIHYDISPKNIFIIKEKDNFKIKLFDFALAEFNQLNRDKKVSKNILYCAPEMILYPDKISSKIDIYSAGASLLFAIYERDNRKSEKFSEIKDELKNKSNYIKSCLNTLKNSKLQRFLEPLLESDPRIRISTAQEAIYLLNSIYNSNYEIPNYEESISFQNNPIFIIRNKIIGNIIETDIPKEKKNAFIFGEPGCGKTKILSQLQLSLAYIYQKIVITKPEKTRKHFSIIVSLLDKLFINNNLNPDIDINKIFSLIKKINFNTDSRTYYQNCYNDLYNFIKIISKDNKFVLVFDDFDKYDSFSKDFLIYLTKNSSDLNIFLIFSFTVSKSDAGILRFIRSEEIKKISSFYSVDPLNSKEMALVLKYFLGTVSNLPPYFNDFIYVFTRGNFTKLMKIYDGMIKDKNIIRIADKYTFISRPKLANRISAYLSKKFNLKSIPEEAVLILKILALSIKPLSARQISYISGLSYDKTTTFLNNYRFKDYVSINLDNNLSQIYSVRACSVKFFLISHYNKEEIILIKDSIIKAGFFNEEEKSYYKIFNTIFDVSANDNEKGKALNRILEFNKYFMRKYWLELCYKAELSEEIRIIILRNLVKIEVELYDFKKSDSYMESLDNRNYQFDYLFEEYFIMKSEYLMHQNKIGEAYKFYYNRLKNIGKNKVKINKTLIFEVYFPFISKLIFRKNFHQAKKLLEFLINKFLKKTKITKNEDLLYIKISSLILKLTDISNEKINEINRLMFPLIRYKNPSEKLLFLTMLYSQIHEVSDLKPDECWDKILKGSMKLFHETRNKEKSSILALTISNKYYNENNYKDAFKYIRYAFENSKNTGRYNFSGMIMLLSARIKYILVHPLSNVFTLINETNKSAEINHDKYLLEEMFKLSVKASVQAGKLSEAKIFFYKAINEVTGLSTLQRYSLLEKLIKKGTLLTGYDKCRAILEKFYYSKKISQLKYDHFQKTIKQKHNDFFMRSSFVSKSSNELLKPDKFEIIGYIIDYLNKNKKMPSESTLHKYLNTRFKDDPLYMVISDTVNYMLSPENISLNQVFKLIKKTFNLGYVWYTFKIMTPLTIYLYIFKNISPTAKSMLVFYNDIFNQLSGNMDNEQKELYEKYYDFKEGKKIIKKYNSLLKNMLN